MSAILPIQVLRALAAFMVAVHHVQPDAAVLARLAGQPFAGSDLLPWMAGVDIFFVVSGFIMVHASASLFDRPGAPALFLKRRLVRIVPLYWAATTLFLLIALALPATLNSAAPSAGQIAASYLFWPALSSSGLVQPVYSLGWTLNYEMLFYALFAMALALPRAVVVPAVTLALAALVGGAALAGPLPLPLGFWGQPIVLEFAAGMGIALLHRRGLQLGHGVRLSLLAAALGLLLFGRHLPLGAGPWRDLAVHGFAAALMVLAAVTGSREPAAPSVLTIALARIGDASYALYLVHPFVIRGLREIFARLGLFEPGLFVATALTGAVIAALLVHKLFEVPVTRTLRRWTGA
ncbi:MAG TPA: acyltransferase [Bosea sp. (in: a-proteobacteria)]|uniref:acyltransferase family protein n=1 Tax=Bosea sp. (in: a-proteobacteria) TaxID=1871050 RepID=UPI002DDCC78C|nr:acyltransferase [Bosea sp. (in: a-proteobacteria)]HEV2552801.1 acyltransferase [Bosea sp. (in: a-proteobacteria)]